MTRTSRIITAAAFALGLAGGVAADRVGAQAHWRVYQDQCGADKPVLYAGESQDGQFFFAGDNGCIVTVLR